MMATNDKRNGISDRSLTFLLAAITAVAPLVMQIYLPALPGIGSDLAASNRAVQLTFSAFVFTVGPAQLLYGPLSDHFGRRKTAIASMLICLAGTLACTLAPNIGWLIAARVLQALGSAGGMVVARAVLSDKYGHDGMAARLSSVIVVIVVVPMLAPLLGGYLTAWFGWRSVFATSAVLIAAVVIVAFIALPETHSRSATREPFVAGTLSLLRKPLFIVYTLQSALSLAVFYTFISVVPYIMENTLGEPPTTYGKFFIMLSAGYMLGNIISSRIASRVGILNMIRAGTSIGLLGSIAMLFSIFGGELDAWHLFAPMILLALANGVASPSMQSGAVLLSTNYAGTASGILGCSQQLVAGVTVQLVSLWGVSSPVPMAISIAAASSAIFACTLMLPLMLNRQPADTTARTTGRAPRGPA